MGNRKKLVKAQGLFHEMGLGRIYPKKMKRHQRPKDYIYKTDTIHELWKLGVAASVHFFVNAKISRVDRISIYHWHGRPLPGVVVLILSNGDMANFVKCSKCGDNGNYCKCLNDVFVEIRRLFGEHFPKSRETLESIFCMACEIRSGKQTREIYNAVKAGCHIHDEDGFLLPEFNIWGDFNFSRKLNSGKLYPFRKYGKHA